MTIKITFEILSIEVEKLYLKQFPETALKEIEEHCILIQNLIESSGWDTTEYLNRWLLDLKRN